MRNKILIVDDVELNREMLAIILSDTYETELLTNGKEAISYIEKHHDEIAVLLLDLIMPEIDGYGVINYMQESGYIDTIPILIISAETSVDAERKCMELGVSDFIKKPFDSGVVKQRVKNVADLFLYKCELEARVEEQTRKLQEQNEILQKQAKEARENSDRIIDILGTVVEYRNLESGAHIKRVKGFTRILAEKLALDYPEYGLKKEQINVIVAASALHDIGKIAIADEVLLKPARLSKDEFDYMKSHTTRGCDIIEQIDVAWDDEYKKACYDICRHHHERYDGKGYPDGLIGEKIPISAQIVSIADVYDALVSERVYKDAYEKEEAYHMILRGECGVFSPKLMECFRNVRSQFEEFSDTVIELKV